MLKFISKLQWLFWIGFIGVFLDNPYLTLFFLFGFCGFANVFSPARNEISNLRQHRTNATIRIIQ